MEAITVKVGLASCGIAAGAEDVYLKLKEHLAGEPQPLRGEAQPGDSHERRGGPLERQARILQP